MTSAAASRLDQSEPVDRLAMLSRTPVRLLIVAEHASSRFGGEALIPFQYFKWMRAVGLDAHLLVHDRTRTELVQEFRGEEGRLHFVTDSKINIWCDKLGSRLPSRVAEFTTGVVSHFDTQLRQRVAALKLLKSGGFTLVHEPIPVSPKVPSLLAGLPVPVVIGPMNGGMDYPPAFDASGRVERLIIKWLRRTSAIMNWLLPGKRQASLLLVANARTRQALPSSLRVRPVRELVENGVDVDLFHPASSVMGNEALRVVYAGRLVDWKRVDLLLAACARIASSVPFTLTIVGDGPLRTDLERQVSELGLADRVRFVGRVPQPVAAQFLQNNDVFVLPSMRECGGAVVLEAMASGLPVIATDWGGPQDYITPDCGVLIPPSNEEAFVVGLANAMIALARNPEERLRMGRVGRERVTKHFSWEQKVKTLIGLYEEVLRGQGLRAQELEI